MPNIAALINKVSKVMNKLNVSERVVYKRKIFRGGGDPLIGKGETVNYVDVQLVPLPVVIRPSVDDGLVVAGIAVVPATDYLLYLSPNSLTAQEIRDKDVLIVFKLAGIENEVCFIASYAPIVLHGAVITYQVLVRSKQR